MSYTEKLLKRYSDGGRYYQGTYDSSGMAGLDAFVGTHDFRKSIESSLLLPKVHFRYLVVQKYFSHALQGTILDVGSRNDGAAQVFKKSVALIDKNNTNLDAWDWDTSPIPFSNEQFDTVVCLDTLEHIADFHAGLQDLMRVAKKYVIISLPNNWRKMFKYMLKGHSQSPSYGLPLEKPFDRHRWFFNTQELEDVIVYQCAKTESRFQPKHWVYSVPNMRWYHRVLYPIMMRLFPRQAKNLLPQTVFVVLEAKG